jgi:holliday junction DNA helicase RuvA
MIVRLQGEVVDKYGATLVVDATGVGYGVQVTLTDFANTAIGTKVVLYIYHHIREQSQDLFGFTNKPAKELFELLLGVKNVGPKVAMAVLDIGIDADVRAAIAGGDVKYIQTAKGVGKRAAEQIVVELRDKVGLSAGSGAESVISRAGVGAQDEATQALIALGYTDADAQAALTGIDLTLSVEEKIKQALKGKL